MKCGQHQRPIVILAISSKDLINTLLYGLQGNFKGKILSYDEISDNCDPRR
jgi:hypothetical protein